MRAITGAVTSSQPCNLRKAARILSVFSEAAASYLPSDCTTYVRAAAEAASDHHNFLCGFVTDLGPHVFEGLVEGARERQSGGLDEAPAGGPHGYIEEAEVAVPADEKKRKKRKKEEEAHDYKAVAAVASHTPASPEIISEQRKKKEKHSNKELLSVVKQEPDLVVEEGGGSERKKKKKKKEKHSDKEVASIVKQEPDLFVEEALGSEKKGKKKKEKDHVNLEENVVEVKGQIVNNGVVEQGVADGDKKRKRKHHSRGR